MVIPYPVYPVKYTSGFICAGVDGLSLLHAIRKQRKIKANDIFSLFTSKFVFESIY